MHFQESVYLNDTETNQQNRCLASPNYYNYNVPRAKAECASLPRVKKKNVFEDNFKKNPILVTEQ